MSHVLLLTGLAGAGRTTASDILEDMGYYVIENLPAGIVIDVVNQMSTSQSQLNRIAITIDIRDIDSIQALIDSRSSLRSKGHSVDLVHLDADDDTIIKRFEQTRRPHPYISAGVLTKGIAIERELLADILVNADVHIDTTTTNPTELAARFNELFGQDSAGMTIVITSFGFKHGIVRDADFIFDVRFLPNPYWDDELREFSGTDERVQAYVRKYELYNDYLESLKSTLSISLNEFEKLGKSFVTIAFGCTGGFHRSVTVAHDVVEWLKGQGKNVVSINREIDE